MIKPDLEATQQQFTERTVWQFVDSNSDRFARAWQQIANGRVILCVKVGKTKIYRFVLRQATEKELDYNRNTNIK